MEKIIAFFASYVNVFKINDLFDIFLVTLAVYWTIKYLRETRAVQLIKGIVVLLVITYLSGALRLNVVNYILSNAFQIGLLALVIVFQPELRHALEQVGRTKMGDWFSFGSGQNNDEFNIIDEICEGADVLSKRRIGALIVLTRKTKLGDVVRTGKTIDANVQSDLIINIFYPNTPLHDGAVVIEDNKIKAAGCLLPLSQNNNLSTELGTRHRAAIGMSENSDAVVLVVSEETGKISVAKSGALTRNFTKESLKRYLEKIFVDSDSQKQSTFAKLRARGK